MDEYKFVNPSTSVTALILPPAYPDGFIFKPPMLPPDWRDKGAEGQQKLAAKMSGWVTTILIIIALLAIVYADMYHLSHGYASPYTHSTLYSEAPHEQIFL